jgi:CheY-like chemotaxis protein
VPLRHGPPSRIEQVVQQYKASQPRLAARIREALVPKVLVVEDKEALRTTIEEALVEAGYHVIAVGDPLLALALVEQGGLELDVLLTDLVMARMGGRELASRVRAHRAGIRILYMSGYDRERAEGSAAAASAPRERLLAKPFSIEDLTRHLHEALNAPAHQP